MGVIWGADHEACVTLGCPPVAAFLYHYLLSLFIEHKAFHDIGGRCDTQNTLNVYESHHDFWLADIHNVAVMKAIDDRSSSLH